MGKLLIVDDNAQITDILANYAAKEGWSALVAADGEAVNGRPRQLGPLLDGLDGQKGLRGRGLRGRVGHGGFLRVEEVSNDSRLHANACFVDRFN